jgi:hypothetical protein
MATQSWRVPTIDYTSRDYESLRDDLLRTLPFFCPEYTDMNPSDFGVVLMELLAYMGDNLHFYIDRMAEESFLPTAITRQSVVNLLKLIDYELRGKTAATVDVTFSIDQALSGDLLIPKGTLLHTYADTSATPIYFETTTALTIPSGYTTGSVSAVEGKTSGTVDDPIILGQSNAAPNQIFTLPETPVIDDSVLVYINEGAGYTKWTIVETLVDSESCSQDCMLFRNANGVVNIYFGDNGQGKIPANGAIVSAIYRVGGGTEGNVGANTITIVDSQILYSGSPIAVEATNPDSATGGTDEQSIQSAKVEGPRALRALYRAITLEDFEALTDIRDNVNAVRATVDRWHNCNRSSAIPVSLFVATEDGSPMALSQKQDILDYLAPRQIAGTTVELFDPAYQPIDIEANIFMYANYATSTVDTNVRESIDDYFNIQSSTYTGFGKASYLSDITSVIDGSEGVAYVDFVKYSRQPTPELEIWSGNATFDATAWFVGDDAINEEWTIVFTSPTTFSVRGYNAGIQGTGSLDAPFLSTNGYFGFILLSGTTPMSVQDKAIVRTSPKIANVVMDTDEFFTEGTVTLRFAYVEESSNKGCVR